jgi:hypothetical protein
MIGIPLSRMMPWYWKRIANDIGWRKSGDAEMTVILSEKFGGFEYDSNLHPPPGV